MQLYDLLPPNLLPAPAAIPQHAAGFPGLSLALTLAALSEHCQKPFFVICQDSLVAASLLPELKYLLPKQNCRLFPDWETLPYDQLSPHQDIISARLEVLSDLPFLKNGVIISSLNAVMPRLPPTEFIRSRSFRLKKGDIRDLEQLRAELTAGGYLQTAQVLSHGEFAVRGSILDIFPMGSQTPFRVDFLDDEVDSIRPFDVESQRSTAPIAAVNLLPAHEFPLDPDGIAAFRSNYRDAFPWGDLREHVIYQAISRGAVPAGIEYYLPLFFASVSSVFSYLPADSVVITVDDTLSAARAFEAEAKKRAGMFEGICDHPSLPPEQLFLSPTEYAQNLEKFSRLSLCRKASAPASPSPTVAIPKSDQGSFSLTKTTAAAATGTPAVSDASPSQSTSGTQAASEPAVFAGSFIFAPNDTQGPEELEGPEGQDADKEGLKGEGLEVPASAVPCFKLVPKIAFSSRDKGSQARFCAFIQEAIRAGGRILISAQSEGRRQSLRETLPYELVKGPGIQAASSMQDFLDSAAPLMLTAAPFGEGCILPAHKLVFLTENELLGFQPGVRRHTTHKSIFSQDALIRNLSQLTEGQIVVHTDHGIGRYRGLRTLIMGGIPGEFIAIEYKDGDLLNIPVTALNKVARYSGAENPPLSKLGTDAWAKKKRRAAEKVRDAAAELLDLYARRASRKGRSFRADPQALGEFAAGFGYAETPDQAAAIRATLDDLAKEQPMDRLICGDVGFGKTEVALRAAFTVASCGAQTAVLVPTTILAEQHYHSFKERFAGTPIIVEAVSRFKTASEQKQILKRLAEGTIDIIIGTHKLLSRTIKFKDLELLIVDEEHRFGVRQKERLKQLQSQVHLLTLTATPIPRTLNMAMEGMRELSIIATPPEHRLAVKTFVMQRQDEAVREAVLRELRRGGQIYYLHNDISTISQREAQLRALVPEARIAVGHGQMNERELQQVMRDFYNQRFSLLLCTTIVENGLDVPTANTIIIDRADLLGLAQLHQIRGRVGRSHHQAYAYLFTPPPQLLGRDAHLRLEAISSLEELGMGFVLATHDLEIRGAGELLGEEQSGQIEAVGFALYSEMLAQAVRALKEGREPSLAELTLNECEVDLHLSALLPENYIHDINTRLSCYKRLSSCHSPWEFEDLRQELLDRFGFLPPQAEQLFEISKLKLLAGELGIKRISGNENGGIMEFSAEHRVDPLYLIKLIQTCKHGEYRMAGQSSLRYTLPESKGRSRIQVLRQLLLALEAHSSLAAGAAQNS